VWTGGVHYFSMIKLCCLKALITFYSSELQLDSIVRRTMKEADKDEDNLIDFEEFSQVTV
jgi:hypothetical protein